VDLECAPLYEPTFDNIFERTLRDSCALDGTSCHSREGAKNGLVFVDADESYSMLLGDQGRERLIPGDPSCSLIVRRIESTGRSQMPPDDPLSESARCAIELWIANGAQR